MDMMMTAAGKDYETIYREQTIKLKRGELIIAERELAKRWKWSRERVRRLLQNLLENGEIRYHRKDHRLSIIFIVKYGTYNPLIYETRPQNKTTDKTTDETTDETNINKSKVNNKIKNKEVVSFDFNKRKFLNITIEDKTGWIDAYPAVDVDQELREMREWLLSHPEKAKKRYRQFITGWLSRRQDKVRTKLSYEEQRKKKLNDWVKKPLED